MALETTHNYFDQMLAGKIRFPDPDGRPGFAKISCVRCSVLIVLEDHDPEAPEVAWCFCSECKSELEEAAGG